MFCYIMTLISLFSKLIKPLVLIFSQLILYYSYRFTKAIKLLLSLSFPINHHSIHINYSLFFMIPLWLFICLIITSTIFVHVFSSFIVYIFLSYQLVPSIWVFPFFTFTFFPNRSAWSQNKALQVFI